jgi:hypothetical protein
MNPDDEIEKRWEQVRATHAEAARKRVELITNPLQLPRFMWEDIQRQATELGVSRDVLVRFWLMERIRDHGT